MEVSHEDRVYERLAFVAIWSRVEADTLLLFYSIYSEESRWAERVLGEAMALHRFLVVDLEGTVSLWLLLAWLQHHGD